VLNGGLCFSTFAISLQLFPSSLIFLSLCSSAGVHGVFVRLFFGLGSDAGASVLAASAAVAPAEDDDAVVAAFAAFAAWSWARLTDLRLREFPGVVGCGKAPEAS
jgi:hypothetical protein